MKVICIDDEFYNGRGRLMSGPKVGEIDEVIYSREDIETWGKQLWYTLKRFPDKFFDADQFAPLSQIDETEMIREYKKELV